MPGGAGEIQLPVYDPTRCALFALGRNAMYAACRTLGLQTGDEVLTPAFDCDGSLQPFRVLGLELRFFRTCPNTLQVDLDDIRKRVNRRTRLIHVINHFGMPQPWDALLAFRSQCEVPILEDNAYSLFSSFDGRPLGTFGDFAIFSLRKNLPLSEGGMLRINGELPTSVLQRREDGRWLYPTEVPAVVSLLLRKAGYGYLPETVRKFARRLRAVADPPPPLYSDGSDGIPAWPLRDVIGNDFSVDYSRPISRFARWRLARLSSQDYAEISGKKVYWYQWLVSRLSDIEGVTVFWPDLPHGVVPFAVLMLVASGRDAWLRTLRSRYEVMAWPTFSMEILRRRDEFPEVEFLGRRVLQLNLPAGRVRSPRYQEHLERFVRDVQELSRRSGGLRGCA